ncbi:MAG: response regulator [Nitrosopumilaceae archaeon]|nr:response regulator [Nitrosopumilaceae archaeon]
MSCADVRILVVEDSESFAKLYQTKLESKGYKVVVTHDGKEELEIFETALNNSPRRRTPFDLIISDNSMPKINGVDAARTIHRIVPQQKIFFVTSEKDLVYKNFEVDGILVDVEQKPISTDLLMRKVDRMLYSM